MRRSLIFGFFAAVLTILAIVYFTPSIDDFRPENPFWNGLSIAAERLNLTLIEDLSELSRIKNASGYALLIIGPSKPFMPDHISYVRDFVAGGGLLVLADDFGSGNTLLYGLDVDVKFGTELLVDPLFKEKIGALPKIKSFFNLDSSFGEIVLNYATFIDGSNFRLIASSSHFSFLDLNFNSRWDEGEPKGPFPVLIEVSYGGGRIILISDPSFLINSMIDSGDNFAIIGLFLSRRKSLLCTSHWLPSIYTRFRVWVFRLVDFTFIPEVRYSILILAAMLLSRFVEGRVERRILSRVEMVLRSHPNWNRDILLRLEEEVGGEG